MSDEVEQIAMDIVPETPEDETPQGGIRTNCRGCIFEEMEGDVQVGCKLGRIAKFEEQGNAVERWADDEGGLHFQIPNRFCTSVRSADWLEAQPDKSMRALKKAIRETNKATVTAVVHVTPGREVRKVFKTLASLKKHAKYVRHVVVVVEDDPALKVKFARWLLVNSAFTWESLDLKPTSPEGMKEYEHAPWLRGVDEALRHPRTMLYTAARAGYQWPDHAFERLDSYLNEEYERIICVGPENEAGDGFFVRFEFHHNPLIRGNITSAIHQKAVWVVEDGGGDWGYASHRDFFKKD